MGSLGLRALVQARWEAETGECALRIVHGNGPTRRTIQLTGLEHVLTLYETLLDATND
jgi:anti-anti-sigma factor